MVGVDVINLPRYSHLKVTELVWGLAATWRSPCAFIKWTGWTLAMALPGWQHHKHQHGYYHYHYYGLLFWSYVSFLQENWTRRFTGGWDTLRVNQTNKSVNAMNWTHLNIIYNSNCYCSESLYGTCHYTTNARIALLRKI